MPTPQQLKGDAVRTYGQDTVLRLPIRDGTNDREVLKQTGKAILDMQFEHEQLSLEDRDQSIIGRLQEMEQDWN